MNLNERIRHLRQKNKLTSKEFGSIFNVAESTVSLYENDKRTPNKDLIIKIAAYFNVSTDYLLGTSDNPQPTHQNDTSFKNNVDVARELQSLLYLVKSNDNILFDNVFVDYKIKNFLEKSIENIIEMTRSLSVDEPNNQRFYKTENE